MSDQLSREIIIFNEAVELPAEQRGAYLDGACGGDAGLRARVESLLEAHGRAGSFLEGAGKEPGLGQAMPGPAAPSEKVGDKIGRYKLLQQIGEGGCGVVYMAEQEEPVRRLVALKVIKLGMDTKNVIARFEAERQALAMMDHPNIAKVLDAGATETGRPYFVMELVRGIKITDYCDQNNLSPPERLKLFIQVCQAIQHAHQKGIIHRDIKPSNILVIMNDGVPAPKVIDFGIAKATSDQRLTDKTVFTAFEQFMGTPAYMSPEQAEMSEVGIDTRSDIYSLGVLLYELLTGRTPFDARELLAAGLEAMRRTIREQEPMRPSTRLSTMMEADLAEIARRRGREPVKMIHLIRGDLDWIVIKCLEKDRQRRYETANGLAVDIERHLNHEPVSASSPGNFYKLQKWVRRNKLVFGALSGVITALLLGTLVSTWQAVRAWRAEQEQNRLRQQAEEARGNEATLRGRAQAGEERARIEAAKSEQVADFLQDMLEGVGPEVAQGQDTTLLRSILEKTEERIVIELTNQPEAQARLYSTLGGVYDQLDNYTKAEAMCRNAIQLQKSVGETNDEFMAELIHHLGLVQSQKGDLAGAETSLRQALAMDLESIGKTNRETVETTAQLAEVLQQRNDFAGAEKMLREALAGMTNLPAPQQAERPQLLNDLGLALWSEGNLSGAETSLAESISLRRSQMGEMNPEAAVALGNLGLVRWESGDLAAAEETTRQTLAIRRKLFGEKHTAVANALNNLANILSDETRLAEAETAQRESVAIETELAGPDHPNTVSARFNLAGILRRRGALSDDAKSFREALELCPEDPCTADGFAAVLARPFLTPVADIAAAPGLWRYTSTLPAANWAAPAFSDAGWMAASNVPGLSHYTRHSEKAVTPRTNLWLRADFQMSGIPSGKLVYRLNRNEDAQVFLNGMPAGPMADWTDAEVLEPCSSAAAATLHPGRNVLALYCETADGGGSIGASLFAVEDPGCGRQRLVEEFSQMIAKQPQRVDLYVGRGSALARCGRLADAAKDFAKAVELEPMSDRAWYGLAPLLAQTDRRTGYPKARQEIVKNFAQPPNPSVAARMARVVLLTPASGNDLDWAKEWANRAATVDTSDRELSGRQLTESLALYREGKYPDAIAWSGKVITGATNRVQPGWTHEGADNQTASAYFIRAMAFRRSGQPDNARAAFAQGTQAMRADLSGPDAGDPGRAWPDLLIAHLLSEEAKAMAP